MILEVSVVGKDACRIYGELRSPEVWSIAKPSAVENFIPYEKQLLVYY
jgi:hypothetical protein